MDSLSNQSYFCRGKFIISSLFGVLLWACRLPFSMQIQKGFPAHQHLRLGLKTLIFPQAAKNPHQSANPDHHPHIIHNHKVSPPSSRYLSFTSSMLVDSTISWSSSAMDDLIGTDSGVLTMLNEEQEKFGFLKNKGKTPLLSMSHDKAKRNTTTQRSERIKREYPPPLPLLAQTGNLQGRMPWVLTKHSSSDGRIVLQGERVKHHEYFEARRENGRLILNLVPLDNAITCPCDDEENGHEDPKLEYLEENLQFVEEEDGAQKAEIQETYVQSDAEDGGDDECDHNNVDEAENAEKKAMDEVVIVLSGYNSVHESPLKMSRCEKYRSLPNFTNFGGDQNSNMVELDSTSFCDAHNIHEHPQTYLGHPASAPLCAMTTVM